MSIGFSRVFKLSVACISVSRFMVSHIIIIVRGNANLINISLAYTCVLHSSGASPHRRNAVHPSAL